MKVKIDLYIISSETRLFKSGFGEMRQAMCLAQLVRVAPGQRGYFSFVTTTVVPCPCS